MLKRAMLLLLVMLTVPNFAMAYNYWSISATSSPVVAGAISAPVDAAKFVTTGTTTNVISSTVTSADFTVNSPAGYALSYVMIDGVKTSPVGGVYTVNKGSKINHTLSAVYATQKYTITTSKTGTGIIDATVLVASGSTKVINMTAGTGYQIGSVTKADGSAIDATFTGNEFSRAYTFANVVADKTIKANFTAVPVVTAKIATSAQSVAVGGSLIIDGSTSIASVTPTYTWSVTPAGATVTQTGATTTFNATAAGTYTVKLTLSAAGATSTEATVLISASSSAALLNQLCTSCHNAKDAQIVANYGLSSHATTTYEVVSCQSCHTNGTDGMNTSNSATDGRTDACSTCHAGNYGIYDTVAAAYKTPHGGGVPAYMGSTGGANDNVAKAGWPAAQTSYLTRGAICTDCHGHNNTINKGFAEGGHGKVSTDPLNAFNHYDWSKQTNNGTRQNGNCDRCHTAAGFMKLLGATSDPAYSRLNAGLTAFASYTSKNITKYQANNVLICVGCHTTTEGGLRTGATPAGNGGPLSGGYFALFSSANTLVAADKTKIQVAFPGYKNSSICIPCHSGRSTDQVFIAVIDYAKAANKNYTTIQTGYYQHAANMGQTFIGKGGYDFTGKLVAIGTSGHAGLNMGANDTQGPCVTCHYSKTDAGHSLEVVPSAATCVATLCHPTVPNVEEAKANFDAGVAALDTLIRSKFAPLQTKVQGVALEEERANVRFGRFGKAAGVAATDATAKAAYGAWYNWQLLSVWDSAAYAHNPRYARQILNDTLGFLQTGVVKTSYGGVDVQAAIAAAQAVTVAPITATQAAAANGFVTAPGCAACHADKVTAFTTTGGYHFTVKKYSCANCHSEQHQTATPSCKCHGDSSLVGGLTPVLDSYNAPTANCAKCHSTVDVHSMAAADLTKGCVDCHDVAIKTHNGKVNDNDGVRAIVPEFTTKRSHHITGGAPTNAQCSVCHLEGKAVAGSIVVDEAYHMKDNKIYLRNVDNAAGKFIWDGADHTAMDNFCFSCHDSDGAADTTTLQALLPAATARNPFADTLTNSYDQTIRAGVVDVKTAFTTTNASHHAVSGQKYKYRFSTQANADAWHARPENAAKPAPLASQIAEGNLALDGTTVIEFGDEPMPADYLAGTHEAEATLYEAGKFVSTYTPLGATEFVADNSTLHCGDCHTVGQWKPNTSTNADGSTVTVAIGAHGSNNDYLLRNALGTDALHTPRTLVCFNCHKTTFPAGNVTNYSQVTGYATAHAVSAFHGQCVADSALQTGVANRLAKSERVDKQATWATVDGGAATNLDSGNITGISCTNCHNSGLRNGFGGIHGGDNTYTDGLGRTQKSHRFLPGMGNYRYAPPGGWDNKDLSDPTLVTKAASGVGAGKGMGGCYTNSTLAGTDPNPGYGACNHHGTSTALSYKGAVPVDVTNGTQRASYGGGNTASPTAVEPVVREATGGTSLVTRPLKY